jgi:hypothetical protein
MRYTAGRQAAGLECQPVLIWNAAFAVTCRCLCERAKRPERKGPSCRRSSSCFSRNSGGDRTWLAPELDFFLPNYPDLSFTGYGQPRQLDPGNYQITHEGDQSVLVNRLTVTSSRSQAIAELEYHVPAIGKGTGRVRSHDVSQVWAFRGAPARIQAIAQSLLSPEV